MWCLMGFYTYDAVRYESNCAKAVLDMPARENKRIVKQLDEHIIQKVVIIVHIIYGIMYANALVSMPIEVECNFWFCANNAKCSSF